ncbi:MAG: sugar isomerase domain-containing protein, partial [Lentisphaerae bacterium]|nr:sugar isomerase domain-containing protein [Lentisphaerota bacterium]
IRRVLDHYERTQMDTIERAAALVADCVLSGGAVHLAAIGHSNEQDFINRAGSPAFLQPLSFSLSLNDPVADCLKNRPSAEPFDRECELVRLALHAGNLRPGDIVAVGSVSGRNVRPVAIALTCREMGIRTIAFTSLPYTAQVESAHPSGRKLAEVADVVIDNGAPFGDAAVAIPGYDFPLMPVSGASMVVGGWMIWGRAMEIMAERGHPASVFMSVNRPGGREIYDRNRERFQKLGY